MNQRGNLLIILLISVVVILGAGGAGVFLYNNKSSPSLTNESPQEIESETVQEKSFSTPLPKNTSPPLSQKPASASGDIVALADWKTYSAANVRFTIKYPGTWYTKTHSVTESPLQVTSQLFNNKPEMDYDSSEFIAEIATINTTYDVVKGLFNYNDGVNTIVSTVEPVTIQGKPAYKVTQLSASFEDKAKEREVKRLQNFYSYIIPQEGYVLELDILKEHDDIAKKMLTTLTTY